MFKTVLYFKKPKEQTLNISKLVEVESTLRKNMIMFMEFLDIKQKKKKRYF